MKKTTQRAATMLLFSVAIVSPQWSVRAEDSSDNDSATSEDISASEVTAKFAKVDRRVVGYYTAWSIYVRKFEVSQIVANKLTHINYAFANISPRGEIVLGDPWADVQKAYKGDRFDEKIKGNFKQLQVLKKKHRHLKTFISVGGWTWSSRFSAAAATDESRSRFAASCVAFVRKYGFDGVDLDWEYPVAGGKTAGKPEDTVNFTLLLAEVRRQLDAQGKKDGEAYLLTIAAPAGPKKIANIEVAKIHKYLDWINVMTYDFNGSWSPMTGFNAPLFAPKDSPDEKDVEWNADVAMKAYEKRGVPKDKLVLGVGFYGRAWKGVVGKNNGMFQSHGGVPKGSWEPGVFDYKHLRRDHVKRFTRHWHKDAKVPWLYDEKSGVVISYDDVESMKAKAQYVVENDFGGVMIWEMSQDAKDESLLETIDDILFDR